VLTLVHLDAPPEPDPVGATNTKLKIRSDSPREDNLQKSSRCVKAVVWMP